MTASHDAIYADNLDINVAGVTMNFDRGYQWVDVRGAGRPMRFVNTSPGAGAPGRPGVVRRRLAPR